MSILKLANTIRSLRPGDKTDILYQDVAAAARMDLQDRQPQRRPLVASPLEIAAYVDKIAREWHVELTLKRPDMIYIARRLNPDGSDPWQPVQDEFEVLP